MINLNGRYDASASLSFFFEAKYVRAESSTFGEQDTFYDTLFIPADNPFIPTELQPVTAVTGGLLLTQDPLDFSENNKDTYTRETTRLVAGFEWEPAAGHTIEVSVNHGVFKNTSDVSGLYLDRIFAAIDSVFDPVSNQIVCRSDLDPNAFYEIDYFTAGNGYANGDYFSNRYYSFTPGDGQCQPLNPFGTYSASPEAQNFVTAYTRDVLEIDQTVISAFATGQFDLFSNLLDGSIGYAAGAEYREESSDNQLDPLTLGILPAGTSFTPGVDVNTVSPWLNSFTSIDNIEQFNSGGGYEVYDVFAEVQIPILQGRQFAEILSLDAAVRLADYSTLGETTTWQISGTWAPISDITFRGTLSEAVRAPNISELFDPPLPIFVNATADPCAANNVNDPAVSANREVNCRAELTGLGVPLTDIEDINGVYNWTNPLSGRFSGISGGDPNLDVETAETITFGAVITPRMIDGLSITVDYWDIKIDNAIAAVAAADILEGCFDSGNYPNLDFCNLFTRRADGGLNFLETNQRNFAGLEASGIDFAVNYGFEYGENNFGVNLVGSYQEKLDRFFNPNDRADVNPDLEEVQLPELSGNLNLSWMRGPLSANFQTTYQSRQFAAGIQNFDRLGDAGFFDEVYIFDANASYEFSDSLRIYGGVNNIADEEPFSTQTAWPVGPRGRFFFMGVNYRR